jgi:hypothetical protein
MRNDIISYLKQQNLRGLALSDDLPFLDGNVELFLQRPRVIYVGATQRSFEPLFQTLSGHGIDNETQTTSVFFTVDAKRLIPGYDDIVNIIRDARNNVNVENSVRQEASVVTDFNNDLLVTQIDIIITKLAN